jgi:hypothetical protein
MVPSEPMIQDGFAMTAWEYVTHLAVPDEAPDRPSDDALELVARLHGLLRSHPGDLPFLSFWNDGTIPECLALLEDQPGLVTPSDLDRAAQEWTLLDTTLRSPDLFSAQFPDAELQVIHGDSPTFNRVETRTGPRIADFELATLGPVEWDLALIADGLEVYNRAASGAGTHQLVPDLLPVMGAARMLQLVSCLALTPQLPSLADSLVPMLEPWRAMPTAGGFHPAPATTTDATDGARSARPADPVPGGVDTQY